MSIYIEALLLICLAIHCQRQPKNHEFLPGSTPICIDTGASCCISSNKEDFLFLTHSSNNTLQCIGGGLSVAGTRTLQWTITDDAGNDIVLQLPNCLYVPSIPMSTYGSTNS
jgi:hypothetical protein